MMFKLSLLLVCLSLTGCKSGDAVLPTPRKIDVPKFDLSSFKRPITPAYNLENHEAYDPAGRVIHMDPSIRLNLLNTQTEGDWVYENGTVLDRRTGAQQASYRAATHSINPTQRRTTTEIFDNYGQFRGRVSAIHTQLPYGRIRTNVESMEEYENGRRIS